MIIKSGITMWSLMLNSECPAQPGEQKLKNGRMLSIPGRLFGMHARKKR